MRELRIDSIRIADDTDAFVIAEIGHNHQGSVETAKEFIKSAHDAGAHAVKFQKRDNKALFTREMYESAYDNRNSYGPTYGAHRDALEFDWDQFVEIRDYCRELGVLCFATPFDFGSVDFLAELDVPCFKTASGDLKSTPLLTHIAKVGKPILVSTGGATMEDVERAVDAILPYNQNVSVLQCTASYPVDPEHMNLKVIETYRERFPDLVIGLSDHQNGIAMAPVAYVLGARIFEKHFTMNRAMRGTDHAFSLEPGGLRKLVRDLGRTRLAIGDGVKQVIECENAPLFKMGKKLVAARELPVGHVLTRDDVALKSPRDGMPPYELEKILGQKLKVALREDGNFRFEDLEAAK